MEIRTYSQKYEAQVVDLWNETMTADPITVQKFRTQALFDDNFDPELCYVALEGDQVVGFCLGMRRKSATVRRNAKPER